MSRGAAEASSLAAAAAALDAELRRYETLSEAFRSEPLTSEKTLRRAAQTLADLQAVDGRMGERLAALVSAIEAARERQQAHAATVLARAEELRQRGARLAALLDRWQALGEDAARVNALMQRLQGADDRSNGHGGGADPAPTFEEVEDRLGRLVEGAGELGRAAAAEAFPDFGRQAESLRLQLLSARNKVRLLQARRA